jgi:hypothetical protein
MRRLAAAVLVSAVALLAPATASAEPGRCDGLIDTGCYYYNNGELTHCGVWVNNSCANASLGA